MKNLIIVILSVLTFTLLGCEEIILEDESETNSTVSGNYLPTKKASEGPEVQLVEYLYPKELVENKTFYFTKVYKYAQNENSEFSAPTISQRSYTIQAINSITRITEYKDAIEQKYDDIYKDKILSYATSIPLEFPINVAKYIMVSEVIENDITKGCQVRDIGAKDLLSVLPLYVKNDLENYLQLEDEGFVFSQFNHERILHIYCGTSDDHTTDSYYSNKFGLVLKVEKDIDKDMVKVEVVDVLSVDN